MLVGRLARVAAGSAPVKPTRFFSFGLSPPALLGLLFSRLLIAALDLFEVSISAGSMNGFNSMVGGEEVMVKTEAGDLAASTKKGKCIRIWIGVV